MGGAHHITIEPIAGRVRVTVGGATVAESRRALSLKEGGMAPVVYVPREDVAMGAMVRTERSSHCPFKGDASYYRLTLGDRVVDDIAWSYEEPKPEVAAIGGHLAFYPGKVDAIAVE